MTETKFTPGPWHRSESDKWDIESPDVADGSVICVVTDPDGDTSALDAECEANAHLIAAAPDLYVALDAIVTAIKEQDIRFGPLTWDAEQALAKARGEVLPQEQP